MNFRKLFIAATLALAAVPVVRAGDIMVKSKLDSTAMMMGSVAPLSVEVVQDKGTRGEFPLLQELSRRGYATMLNDTVEISAAAKPDTVEIGSNRIQINYHLLVQIFDSGYYQLPPLVYVSGRDSVRTEPIFIKINPVKVTADDKISPMTDVQPNEHPSIFDNLPDWLVNWWWMLLVVIAVALLTWWGVRRYRTQGSLLPPKPVVPPHVEALERLRRLKARKLWEEGHEKEYYTILTDILRIYLDKRFGIKAMEMTSREIMQTLSADKSLVAGKAMMRQILDMADFVKFAKVRPLPDDNVKSYDNAVRFIEDTMPKPEEAADGAAAGDTAAATDSKRETAVTGTKKPARKSKRGGES